MVYCWNKVIDGNNNDANVVTFNSGEDVNSILIGLTIDNAKKYGIVCGPNIPSSPTISKCIVKNSGSHGIYCPSGQPLIANSKLCFNAGYGIYSSASSFILKNSHIYKNNQGGIRLDSSASASEIRNNTIAYNTSRGVYVCSGVDPVISNCILWENSDDLIDCNATYSCIQDNDFGTGNIYSDPNFVNHDINDCSLKRTSLCINAGDPNVNYQNQTDIDNQTRLAKNADIGADEVCELHNIDKDIWYSCNDNQGIQTAINEANDLETIEIYQWTFNESIDFGSKNIVLTNPNYGYWSKVEETVINANNSTVSVVTFAGGQDSNSIIRGIKITGGNCGIYCGNSSSPKIIKCIIADNNSHGIYCQSGSPLINANKICANKGDGVSSSSSVPPIVAFNWIYSNNNGLTVADANSALQSINNTVVYNKAYGIYHSTGAAPYINSCIVWGHDSNDLYDCNATYSYIQDVNDASGFHNYLENPQFQNADSNNFHLAPNSPYPEGADHNNIDRTDLIDIDGEIPHSPPGGDSVAPYYVDWTSNGGDGKSWETAFRTLEEALEACGFGGEIWVAEGTYIPDVSQGRYATFQLKEDIAIYGGFPNGGNTTGETDPKAHPTILSGDIDLNDETDETQNDNCYHVVTGAKHAVLDGFIIKQGYADGTGLIGCGGGILMLDNMNTSYNMTISNCSFENNYALNGGAIYAYRCVYNMSKCKFKNNTGMERGGAVHNFKCSTKISKCTFENNKTDTYGRGGAIYTFGYLSYKSSHFPIYCPILYPDEIQSYPYDTGEITNCFFVGNYAGTGGALLNESCMPRINISNCIFYKNIARSSGGAISNRVDDTDLYFESNAKYDELYLGDIGSAEINIRNCTFAKNQAPAGGTIANYVDFYISLQLKLYNSILWDNVAARTSWKNFINTGDTEYISIVTNSSLIDVNPKFVMFGDDGEDDRLMEYMEPDDGDDGDDLAGEAAGPDGIYGTNDDGLRLAVGSPCKGQGSNDYVSDIDMDIIGTERIVGTNVDIGAYEYYADSDGDGLYEKMKLSQVLIQLRPTLMVTDWQTAIAEFYWFQILQMV